MDDHDCKPRTALSLTGRRSSSGPLPGSGSGVGLALGGAVLALALGGAGGCAHLDNRTAVEHEHEAEQLRGHAELARATVRVYETTQPVPSVNDVAVGPGPTPTQVATGSAGRDIAQAVEHEQVAQRIRAAAEASCRRVPPAERSSCPLPAGPGVRSEPMARGVRIISGGGGDGEAEALRARIDCAEAQSHVERTPDTATCPLLVPGARTRVVDRPGGAVLEITGPDEVIGAEVRRRTEARLAPEAPPASPPGSPPPGPSEGPP